MAGQQVTIVLDAKLPLDEGKGQVAYLGHRAADEAIYRHDGQRNRQPGKLLQNHTVEQQENAAGQDAADVALQGFVGADLGDAPVLTQEHAGKIGSGIGKKRTDHRQQYQVPAMVHALELYQGRQAHGDHQAPKHAHEHVLHPHSPLLVIQTDSDTEHQRLPALSIQTPEAILLFRLLLVDGKGEYL